MRAGISMVSKRHARVNIPLVSGCNPQKPTSHVQYLNANNLYGWAMSQSLPVRGFQWVGKPEKLNTALITEHPGSGPEGYILEVDLEYPEELQEAHNAYALVPERLVVKKEWMSEYQLNLCSDGGGTNEVEKLVPNLCNKDRYVMHYRNLQLYLKPGMHLKIID